MVAPATAPAPGNYVSMQHLAVLPLTLRSPNRHRSHHHLPTPQLIFLLYVQVRNSSVRTLFLAAGSHGGKFDGATWREVMWDLLFALVRHIYHMSHTSSCEEVQASELGKEKGPWVWVWVG